MRKWIHLTPLLCGIMACVLMLTGCLGGNPKYMDKVFLADLGAGLNKRWDLYEQFERESGGKLTTEQFDELVQCEFEAFSFDVYDPERFEDPKLQKLVESYLNALNMQRAESELYTSRSLTDDERDRLIRAHGERALALKNILDAYEVKTDKKHEGYRSALIADGREMQRFIDAEAKLQKVADATEFSFSKDDWGRIEGVATFTNTTGMRFAKVQFDFEFYDDSGELTGSEWVSVKNWKDGEAFDYTSTSAFDEPPAKVKITPWSWMLESEAPQGRCY